MRPGGRADPSAHTHARHVIHSRLASWSLCFDFFFLTKLLLKTLFELLIAPSMKPFSSILYVFSASMSYSTILCCNRSKYSLYSPHESACSHWWSMLVLQADISRDERRLMKRVTQLSFSCSLAIADAKFPTISRVGAGRRLLSSSIYLTSSPFAVG